MNNIDKIKKKYNDDEMFLIGTLDYFAIYKYNIKNYKKVEYE